MSRYTAVKVRRNDGREFIADGTDWKLTALSGIDAPEFEVFTEKKGIGDGDIVVGKRTSARTFSFTANVLNPAHNELHRKEAVSFFNSRYSYRVDITYQGTSRWIICELEKYAVPALNVYDRIEVTAEFYAADPYWKSVDDFGRDIASLTPHFGFPFVCVENKGINCGIFNFAKTVLIENDGDTDTYCKAIIAASGDVLNPSLIKGDKFVKVLDTMCAGDVIEIDLERATVLKNGANIIGRADRKSSFVNMHLEVGTNKIGYAADNGDNYLSCTIYYNKLYCGI